MDSNINVESSPFPVDPTPIGDPNSESIPSGSHGAQNSQTVESNTAVGANVETEVEETNPFTSKKRKKTAACWQEFKEIEIPDGTSRAECVHCKLRLVIKKDGPTSTLTRHLGLCPRRKVNQKKGQQTLSYQSVPSFSSGEPPMSSLTNFKYDHSKMREATAQWVLMHNHPFNVVEEDGFNHMMRVGCPWYEKISRTTVKNDCVSVYEIEKKKIKLMLKKANKVSLTTDLWKSGQRISYMVVTAHFVDVNWNLQKRIINFVDVPPPHQGVDIADTLCKCAREWGIENKVFSVSVDNASYNDVAIRISKDYFSVNNKLVLDGKLFHVRCCAHILNLLVQDGLKEIEHIIDNVRESVKYLKNSEGRLLKFAEIVKHLQLSSRRLILDYPTRWSSTYNMLVAAIAVKDAFYRYASRDPNYDYLPSVQDWERAKEVCGILEIFSDATNLISGSEYPTSNLFLSEVYRVKEVLNERENDEHEYIRAMVGKMKLKFDKYWGQVNLLMAIAAVLDPRCKMLMIEFCFPLMYNERESATNIDMVRKALKDMYEEYVAIYSTHTVEEGGSHESSQSSLPTGGGSTSAKSSGSGWKKFDTFVRSVECGAPKKSELDVYLDEGCYVTNKEKSNEDFNALEWWKANMLKYRFLTRMAADVLAIPASTVASESAFSAGGRVIDSYRSSLATTTVQMLMCGGDWTRQAFQMNKKAKVIDMDEVITLPEC